MIDTETIPEKRDSSKAAAQRRPNAPFHGAERQHRLDFVLGAREIGKTWNEIGKSLGVSGVAVLNFVRREVQPKRKRREHSVVELLRRDCEYVPTGVLIRKTGPKKGQPIGSMKSTGYLQCCFNRKVYPVHHLVWMFHFGERHQSEVLDHINRDPLDNRIENLRPATFALNAHNSEIGKRNKTGFKGVYQDSGKYRSEIKIDGKTHFCGIFDTAIEAARAYDRVAIDHFGPVATTNETLGAYAAHTQSAEALQIAREVFAESALAKSLASAFADMAGYKPQDPGLFTATEISALKSEVTRRLHRNQVIRDWAA